MTNLLHRLEIENYTFSISGKNKVTDEDAINLINTCFHTNVTREDYNTFSRVHKFILYTDDIPMGMFWLDTTLSKYTAILTNFCIKEEYRGKMLGSKLFQFMKGLCRVSTAIENVIFTSSVSLQKFYTKQGGCDIISQNKVEILWQLKI